MQPPLGSQQAHEQIALDIRKKMGKWVSIHDEVPLCAINDVGDGWGFGTNNFFDFGGGEAKVEFLAAQAKLISVIEKYSTLKRPYRVILIAGPFTPNEQG